MSAGSIERYRAACVWVDATTQYAPGELRVRDGRVVSVGLVRTRRVPDRVIVPGLVNAHVHLQIPPLERAQREFLDWVGAVMAARSQRTDAEHVAQARAALRSLRREGVAAVGEIDSTGLSPRALHEVRLGGVCYQELTGFHLGPQPARALVCRRSRPGTRSCVGGLSPHAPYSVSAALFRAAVRSGRRLAIHVAETEAEIEFLRSGRGPFRDLLERLDRLPPGFRAPRCGAVEHLDRLGVLRTRPALIHAQHLSAGEVARVAARRAPIVVCPGTIRYFRREPPDVGAWLRRGIVVALGTDSVASNTELSMRHELRLARRVWPGLAAADLLAMATCHGGQALGRPGVGTLRRGVAANFLALPARASVPASLEAFCAGAEPPLGVWMRGRRVRRSP